MDDDLEVELPIDGTLDLHTFRPKDVSSLVPEWLAACRRAGVLEVRVVHGKGTGALAAGVRPLLERSPFVRSVRTDGNWGGVVCALWDPASDESRIRALLGECPRFVAILRTVAVEGPPGAWVAAGAVRNRVWHRFHGREGEPDDTDVDVAWAGDGSAEADAAWEARLRARLDAPWEVVDQRRYGAASAEVGMARWPETATGIGVRGADLATAELFAAHGWEDVIGMVVRPAPGVSPETWRSRLATKQWRRRFPWVRIERD